MTSNITIQCESEAVKETVMDYLRYISSSAGFDHLSATRQGSTVIVKDISGEDYE